MVRMIQTVPLSADPSVKVYSNCQTIRVKEHKWGILDAKSLISLIAYGVANRADLDEGDEVEVEVILKVRKKVKGGKNGKSTKISKTHKTNKTSNKTCRSKVIKGGRNGSNSGKRK